MCKRTQFILIFCLLLTGCAAAPKNILLAPMAVEYTPGELSKPLITKCRTDHQGFHEVNRSKAYKNKDESLSVFFKPDLPAYWLGMEFLIKDKNFQAKPYGAPFAPGKVYFEVTKQELILRDSPVIQGTTLNGCASVNFTQHEEDGTSSTYFFTGCFSARIYPAQGAPSLTAEGLNFLAGQELGLARYELGEAHP